MKKLPSALRALTLRALVGSVYLIYVIYVKKNALIEELGDRCPCHAKGHRLLVTFVRKEQGPRPDRRTSCSECAHWTISGILA